MQLMSIIDLNDISFAGPRTVWAYTGGLSVRDRGRGEVFTLSGRGAEVNSEVFTITGQQERGGGGGGGVEP